MSSIKENNRLGNSNQQRSNSGSTLTTPNSATQTLKREQGNKITQEKRKQQKEQREGQPKWD